MNYETNRKRRFSSGDRESFKSNMIMDYKEKYEQALERAKYYHDRDSIQFLENIFPELAESEDERIRKEIISFVRRFIECHDKPNAERDEKYESWIAWLEKQGEQKPAEFDDTNAKRMFIKALERVEEQNNKGYKLTDCDKSSWWEDFKAYTSCIIEQKHAWSEEDESYLNTTIAYLKDAKEFKKTAENCIDWLNSLKDRYTWKPSDEQIEALDFAIDCIGPDEFCFKRKELKGLLEQLKKL